MCHITVMHFQLVQYLELAHRDYSSRNKRNRTSLLTMILTYWRWIWPFAHGAQRRRHPSSRRQSNTIVDRLECMCHTALFRKDLCAQEHQLFYALTTLLPTISRHKRRHIRAAKKDGDSNDYPIFSQTHFHSVKWLTPRVLSVLIMMALTWISVTSLLLCLLRR